MFRKKFAIVYVQIFAPIERVWEGITNPELIKKWLHGTDTESDWELGSPITFKGEWKGKPYTDKGWIKNIIENKLLRYTWWSPLSGRPDARENYATITFNLSEAPGGTGLALTQDSIETMEGVDQSEKNWTLVLNKLKAVLESGLKR